MIRTTKEKIEIAKAAIAWKESGKKLVNFQKQTGIAMSLIVRYRKEYLDGKYGESQDIPSDLIDIISEELNGNEYIEPEIIQIIVYTTNPGINLIIDIEKPEISGSSKSDIERYETELQKRIIEQLRYGVVGSWFSII